MKIDKYKKHFQDDFEKDFRLKRDKAKHHKDNEKHCNDPHDCCSPNFDEHDEDCVCAIVKKIHKAQMEVEEFDCKVSCGKSINQLLSPAPTANTIPFTLTCGCDLFIGKAPIYNKKSNFQLICSPFLRVKNIKKDCCAVLELLLPTCDGKVCKDVLHDFEKQPLSCEIDGFIGTGACITVDLDCFCSISCFKPHKVDPATPCSTQHIFKDKKHDKC